MEKQRALKILTDLISIESVNDNEEQVADYIAALFKDYNAKIEKVTYAPNRANLVVTIGQSGPLLGFSGHEDVVAANALDWKYGDPFSGQIIDDKIYGRGASDMKSGLAAMVVAMLDLLAEHPNLPGRLRLLASVGEETGEYGAEQLVQEGYAQDLDGLIIGEPTNFTVNIAHKGVIDYRVDSKGFAAHSSTPERGKNAILPLLQFADRAQSLLQSYTQVDEQLGHLTHVISQIQGGNQINSVPDSAWLTGNIRTTPQTPNQQIMQELRQLVADLNAQGADLTIEFPYPELPLASQEQTDLAQLAQKVLQQKFNLVGEFSVGTGATDASEYVKAEIPIIILGAASGQTDHQVDENIPVADYLLGCEIYKQLALSFWQS